MKNWSSSFRSQAHRLGGVLPLLLLLGAVPASAFQVDWTGTLVQVDADTGGGLFAGTGLGDGFSGSFVYGNTCGTGCSVVIDPHETSYAFASGTAFSSFLTNGTDTLTVFDAIVSIENDSPLDAQDAALVSGLLGMPVAVGTLFDAFTLEAQTSDVAFDSADNLTQGGVLEVVLASFDTTLFSDTSFHAEPPAIGSVDFAFFFVEEADSGATLYDVAGALAQAVPEPGASLLLTPLCAFGLARPRRAWLRSEPTTSRPPSSSTTRCSESCG